VWTLVPLEGSWFGACAASMARLGDRSSATPLRTVPEAANSLAEFQLKRFGMVGQENSTDGLVAYLNKMNGRYAPSDATCLVAIGDIEAIDFPRVGDEVEKEAFPFAELLLVGVAADKFIIAGIKPHKGWGVAYDLQLVVR
jgi:hypothetical protein